MMTPAVAEKAHGEEVKQMKAGLERGARVLCCLGRITSWLSRSARARDMGGGKS
jgi:hypothetical protein